MPSLRKEAAAAAIRDTDQTAEFDDIVQADEFTAMALALLDQQDHAAAIEVCGSVIETLPSWHMPYFVMGLALHGRGEKSAAIEMFLQCAQRNPYFDAAYENAAQICLELGLRGRALEIAMRMERFVPGHADNRFRIGSLYLLDEDYEAAKHYFDAGLNSPVPQRLSRMLDFGTVSLPRLLHDERQIDHLLQLGMLDDEFVSVRHSYRQALHEYPAALAQAASSADGDWQLPENVLSRLTQFYRRAAHLEPCPRTPGEAINPGLDIDGVVEDFFDQPEPLNYAVIDDLLSPEALDRLVGYLNRSTIWHNDSQRGRNYIGAYRDMGLMCPLMDQVIEELQARFAPIVGDLCLREIWAYRLVTGATAIGTHADFSETNINVWLTPNSANRVAGTGGLTLYETSCPQDWSFEDYNDNENKIAAMIGGARKIDIPYRQNRAVVFNASMFHASQPTHFADAYEANRINLTFLFGQR
jgi:hypothetical protein